MREVVVTGIGMITPFGATARESLLAWHDGRSVERCTCPELKGSSLEEIPVAALPDFDPAERVGDKRMLKYMSFATLLGCGAAHEAITEAGLERIAGERIGLFVGTGLAAASVNEVSQMLDHSIDESGNFSCQLFGSKGLAATNPLLSFRILANMPACLVSIIEKIKGPNYIFTPWEGQTSAALVEAWRAVATGECECAVTGAADHATHPSTILYLRQSGLLRENDYPASGAAYLVMESLDSARAHERKPITRIADMTLEFTGTPVDDPLAERMGRSYAAAPAILMALECLSGSSGFTITGVDAHRFSVRLGAVA